MLLGFAGGLHDEDTGFVRFGWRDYDPDTGRWTAPDPIGLLGGDPDVYGYCLDDPICLADRKGLHPNWAEDEEEKGFKFGKRPLEGLSSMEVPGLEGLKTLLSFPFLPANGFQSVQGMRTSMEHAREIDDANNTWA